MDEKPPTLEEQVEMTKPQLCEQEVKRIKDKRVREVIELLEDMRENEEAEEYFDIVGEEICSPTATRLNRYILMVMMLLIERVGTTARACQLLGLSPKTVSMYRQKYPALREAMDRSQLRYGGMLVDAATEFAINGWEEEVYGKMPGKDAGIGLIGKKKKRDMRLLETLLSANVKKFKKQTIDTAAMGGMTINLNFGDGSQEVLDGNTGEVIDIHPPQMVTEGLPGASVEVHDDETEGIEEE